MSDIRRAVTQLGGTPDSSSDITVIIKTFERPCCLLRLLVSVRRFFPSVPILVCDDSFAPLFDNDSEPAPGVRWLTLPFAAGHTLGAGRNHLVAHVTTPYFFLCDDDHVFTAATRLGAMREFLDHSHFDIVGGAQGKVYGAAIFERRGDAIVQRFHAHRGLVAPGVVACDRVSNTFLARTHTVKTVRWEEYVYAGEHADFFLRAKKAGLRVAQMGRTMVAHDRKCEKPRALWLPEIFVPHRDTSYAKLRLGGGDSLARARQHAQHAYATYVLAAHGVSAIKDVASPFSRWRLERLIGRPDSALRL